MIIRNNVTDVLYSKFGTYGNHEKSSERINCGHNPEISICRRTYDSKKQRN